MLYISKVAKIPISTNVTVNFSYVLDKGVQFIIKYYNINRTKKFSCALSLSFTKQ